MVRTHGLLVAALALGLIGAACSKDEKKPGAPATGDKAAEKADKPADKPAVAADPGSGKPSAAIAVNANADDLSLLPLDSEIVLGLNFSQLQQSMLWKKFAEPKLMSADVQSKLGEFKDKCGFDPMTAVKSVSVGLKGVGGAGKPEGAIVIHGLDKAKTMACIDKMKDEAAKDGDKMDVTAGIVTVSTKSGDTFAFTFTNDNTLLAVAGPNGNAAGVKAAAAGTSALKTSPAFVDMYSKINTGDSLWLLMNGNSKAFEKAAQMGFKPKAVFGSVNVTDGLTVDLRMRLDTPDQATQIANMAKGQAAGAKAMFDKLDITNENADVHVSLALSPQKLQSLVQQLGGLIGGMGGMGGGGSMGGGAGNP